MVTLAEIRREWTPMLRLATPLAVAELGWMAMGFVDTVMAGRLGPAALGAGSLGQSLFFPIAICGSGLLLGLDTLVSQAFGAKNEPDCRRSLVAGLWMALGVAPVVAAALWGSVAVVRAAGTNPNVVELLGPFVLALIPGIWPLLIFSALRRYLQARNIAKPITFAVVSANVINFAGNWVLMFGHWGAPRMGLTGSGWSTSIARFYIAAVLAAATILHERKHGYLLFRVKRSPDLARIRELFRLGVPSALQIVIEGAIFSVATVLASKLDEISLAAHSIAVNVISVTYMVPLGISAAAAVRVGQAVGRKDRRGVSAAGWTALLESALFMGSAGLVLAIVPRAVVRLYTGHAMTIAGGAVLLRIAAVFELFDGFQVVAMGALRGLGDTRTPVVAHLVGYWAIGMPVTYLLCFQAGWGVRGIWTGLSMALVLIGAALLVVWRHRTAHARG